MTLQCRYRTVYRITGVYNILKALGGEMMMMCMNKMVMYEYALVKRFCTYQIILGE